METLDLLKLYHSNSATVFESKSNGITLDKCLDMLDSISPIEGYSNFFKYKNKEGDTGVAFRILYQDGKSSLVSVAKKLWCDIKADDTPNLNATIMIGKDGKSIVYIGNILINKL